MMVNLHLFLLTLFLFANLNLEGQDTWINVSRTIMPDLQSSGAFYLDPPSSITVEFPGQFIGDVDRGGSCNVQYLTFCPHNITHVETSAHVLSPSSNPPTVADLDNRALIGKGFLIDLSFLDTAFNAKILPRHIMPILDTLTHSIDFIIIKTRSSDLPEDFDFSGHGFMALTRLKQ